MLVTIHHKGKKLSALTIAPVEAGGVWPAKGEFGRWRDVVQQYGIKRGCLYNLVAEGKVKSVSLRRKGNVKGCRLGNRHGHRYRRGCPWNFAPRYPLIIFLNECQTMTPSILSFPDLPCCFRRIIQPFTITQQRNLNLLKRSMLKNIIRDLVKDVHGACLRNDVPDSENKRQQGCFLRGEIIREPSRFVVSIICTLLVICSERSSFKKLLLRELNLWLLGRRFFLRLGGVDVVPRRRAPEVQEAITAQGADDIAVG